MLRARVGRADKGSTVVTPAKVNRMNAIRTAILAPAAIAVAILALPSSAIAEEVVPPGNSAATQYTEAIPTAGGPKQTGRPKHRHSQSPSKVLGARNAHKLDSRGATGHAVATLAAETAPAPTPAATESAPRAASPHREGAGQPAGAGSRGGGPAPKPTQPRHETGGAPPAGEQAPAGAHLPNGSSGFGQVLAKATGTSSGETGLLLPLALLATLAWAVAYALRRRKRTIA